MPYKIKDIMKAKGIGNKELSQKSGIPIGTLNKIIYGNTINPTLGNMQALAEALNCKIDDFIEHKKTTTVTLQDENDWTPKELEEIKQFKQFLKMKRKKV